MLLRLAIWCVMEYIWIHLLISSNGILFMKTKTEDKNVRLNTFILTKVKVQLTNDVALPNIA